MSLPHSNFVRIRYYKLPLSENNVSIRAGARVGVEAELSFVLAEAVEGRGTDYLDMVVVVGEILDMPHSSETMANPVMKYKV